MKNTFPAKIICSAIISMSAVAPAFADDAELAKKIDKLSAELDALKAELAASRKKTEEVEKKQEALTATVEKNTATAAAATAAPSMQNQSPSGALANTVIGSYGEINYTRPTHATNNAQADVARAVISMEHRFDEQTKMVAEFEWEHAVTSADDQGESEVEQLYVEHALSNGLQAKAGLFLIPSGLLNTNHEPTAYYGVHRNFVETAIIPSTWREAGIGISRTQDNGLTWDLGLTTGFDLSKWDATSTEGRDSPLGSIHQEGQLAKAHDLSVYMALNWRGIPGLLLGGSIFTGKAGQSTSGFAANDARVTLWDLHARYTPGLWDLSALYARGTISNTEALNTTFVGEPTPVPSSFDGWYAQAAYQLWKNQRYTLSPFVRYEQFNTARSYASVPAGLGVAPTSDEKVATVGANFKIGEGVVLKADYQKFKRDRNLDSLNLGVGYSF